MQLCALLSFKFLRFLRYMRSVQHEKLVIIYIAQPPLMLAWFALQLFARTLASYDKLRKQQAKEAKGGKGTVPAAMQTPATPVPVPDVTAPGATPAAPQAAMAPPADTQFNQDFDATFAPRQKAGMPAAQPVVELPPVAAQAPAAPAEKIPVDAAQTGPAVKGPDNKQYYKVMVGDKVMYAPADRVTRLSGPDLYKAQADALDRIDPVLAAALRKTVIGMEKDNIELSTMKMAQGVQVAKAAAANTATSFPQCTCSS